MGPNGTGKSTLASAIMGHPKYEITGGSIHMNGEDVLEMEVDERAQAGLFLAMQYQVKLVGLQIRTSYVQQSMHSVKKETKFRS